MNIFVTSSNPIDSANVLPDSHICKMGIETCQMIALVYSKWYFDWGTIPKKDRTPYKTERGAFRNHPCTVWAARNVNNLAWLIMHGFGLCDEFDRRYGRSHGCLDTLIVAYNIFETNIGMRPNRIPHLCELNEFTRAMPDELKYDESISTFEAYKRYIASKPWAATDYVRAPHRKPDWIETNSA